jgi:uridine kinase
MSTTLIGIVGGSCSGKSSISKKFKQSFGKNCQTICEDSFYKSLTEDQLKTVKDYNFDHPDAINFKELERVIINIKSGKKKIMMPCYDLKTHQSSRYIEMDLSDVQVIILEGIFLFHHENIRNMLDIKIYVDTDSDIRLTRRIYRDQIERGRTLESILDRYHKFVKLGYEKYIEPCKKYANIIIPYGVENYPFLDIFCHIFCKYTQQ